MWRNDIKGKYMFMFTLKNLARKGLMNMVNIATGNGLLPGGWFNKTMPSYQYRKSHCGDKTILRPSYLHNGISYTNKMTSFYWIRDLMATSHYQDQCWLVSRRSCSIHFHKNFQISWNNLGLKVTHLKLLPHLLMVNELIDWLIIEITLSVFPAGLMPPWTHST